MVEQKVQELKRQLVTEVVDKVGQKVKVQGWASTVRDHGSLVFIDLRDWSGIVQVVINEEDKVPYEVAKEIGIEYVISVEGEVLERSESAKNDKIPTGKIEIKAEKIEILNKCKPLPFTLSESGKEIDENIRLKNRFVDMRRKRVRDHIASRSEMLNFTTNWFTSHGFTQVQTPLLTVSSPEGARDMLIPSRLYPGTFYALPQSPQQYKQLLMVGGLHRYFQIAPCFRDEDPRADRHYGSFYQVDTEYSFVTQEEIWESVEPYFKDIVEHMSDKKIVQYPFPRIPYNDAWDMYGSDKPDIRFELKLADVTEQFKNSEMQVFKSIECAKSIVVDKEFSRKEIDELTEKIKQQGAKGLVALAINDGKLEGSILKFFNEELQKDIIASFEKAGYKLQGKQTFFAVAGEKRPTQKQMGWLRTTMANQLNLIDQKKIGFVWIIDFDMFEWSETENRWDFMHNPFSMPKGGLEALKTQKPDEIKAQQYDLACNGYEIISGSIRNHHPETFIEAFKVCGYSEEETRSKFGHMISAFEFGAPPHGGYAIGFDRFMMTLFDEENIREIYAFPTASNGQEIMTGAPRAVAKKDLDILGIKLADRGAEVRESVVAKLDSVKVKYQIVEHEEARTSEDAAKFRGTKLSEGAKAIVLHSLEYASKYIQVVVPADKQVSISKVIELTGEKFEVGKTEDVEKFTGLKVGAIPPFGRLMGMEVYFDGAFWAKDRVAFNVGSRDKSIIMQAADLIIAAEPNKHSKGCDLTE